MEIEESKLELESLFHGSFLSKSAEIAEDVEGWRFSGIASDETEDVQGDVILKKSLDLTYAQKRGFVNWDHGRNPEDQIGYITRAEIISKDRQGELSKSLGVDLADTASVYVEGRLYKYVDRAAAVQKILRSMKEDPIPSQGLGLSVDGLLLRNVETGEIMKALVRGVAITPAPAHTKTLCALIKSLSTYSNSRNESIAENSELVKSLSLDEASLWVLKQRPDWTYANVVKFITSVIDKGRG